jgi:hypothetical protein
VSAPAAGEVRDEPRNHRFVAVEDGALAQLVYAVRPGIFEIVHTEVPDALGGHGIGGRLVRAAVTRAAADGLTIVPSCSFARGWLEGHPDVAETVTIDWAAPHS